MKKMLVLVGVVLLFSSLAFGAPLCGGAQNVLAPGFECEIGGLLFNNFSVVNAGGVPTPSMTLVSANQSSGWVYLNFNPSLATPTASQDIWFYYTVTGGINGIDLGVGGTNATITERACLTPINPDAGNTCTGGIGNQLAAMTVFSGNSSSMEWGDNFESPVYVFKNILVQGPGELSAFSQSFHVPEPMSFLLIGTGLLGLGLLRRKVRKS